MPNGDPIQTATGSPIEASLPVPSDYPSDLNVKTEEPSAPPKTADVGKMVFEDFFPPLNLTQEQEDFLAQWFTRDLKACVKNVNRMSDVWAKFRAVYMLEYTEKFYPDMGIGADYASGVLCEKVLEGMDRISRAVLTPRPLFVVDDRTSNVESIDFMHRAEWFQHTTFEVDLDIANILDPEGFFEFLLDGSFILEADQLYEKVPQRAIETYLTADQLIADQEKILDSSEFEVALDKVSNGQSARVLVEKDVLTKEGLQIFKVDKVDHLIPPNVFSDRDIRFRGRRMYLTKADLNLLASEGANWYEKEKVDKVLSTREARAVNYTASQRGGKGSGQAVAQEEVYRGESGVLSFDWRREEESLRPDQTSLPYKDTFAVYRVLCKYGYKTKTDPDGLIPKYCLAGDTLIHTVKGNFPIRDLVGQTPILFGYDHKHKRIKAVRASKVAKTGCKPVVEVAYKWWVPTDGVRHGKIRLTSDHKVLLRDRTYKLAGELKEGDSLMPFSHTINRQGYRKIWLNDPLRTVVWEHHLVYNDLVGDLPLGEYIHHLNSNTGDNSPKNLIGVTVKEHAKIHGKMRGDRLRKYWQSMSKEEMFRTLSNRNKEVWKKGRRNYLKEYWEGKTPEERSVIASETNRKAWASGKRKRKFCGNQYVKIGNHTVVSVELLPAEDVYDIEVPTTHNFAAANIMVHNCIFDFEPESQTILRARTYPHFHERKNYFHFKLGHAPKSYYGFGYGARLISDDFLESNAVDLFLDSAAMATFKPFICLHPEVSDGIVPFRDGLAPNKMGFVRNMTDFRELNISAPSASLIEYLLPITKTRAENKTSITSLVQGRTETSDPRAPAQKAQMLLGEAQIGLEAQVKDWNKAWNSLASFVWTSSYENLVYQGEDFYEDKIIFPGLDPELEKVNRITLEELGRKIQWKSQASALLLNSEVREMTFLRHFQFYSPLIQQLATINPELYKKYFLRWMRWAAQEMGVRGLRYLIPSIEELGDIPAENVSKMWEGSLTQLKTGQTPEVGQEPGGES